MKCAFELKQIADEVNEKKEKERKIRMMEHLQDFLTTLNLDLIATAQDGKYSLDYIFGYNQCSDKSLCTPLKYGKTKAGRPKYIEISASFSINYLTEILKPLCIKIEREEIARDTNCWNDYFWRRFERITFSFANPDCLSDS